MDGSTVKLSWKEPAFVDGSLVSGGKIVYFVYVSESYRQATLHTVCQMRLADSKDKANMVADTSSQFGTNGMVMFDHQICCGMSHIKLIQVTECLATQTIYRWPGLINIPN